MFKKVIILLSLFTLTACTQGEDVACTVNGKTEVYNIKDGLVESLTVDNDKKDMADVDELNGTYFTSAKDNEDLKKLIYDYVSQRGGQCN